MFLKAPRGMRSPAVRAERLAMLETVESVQVLREWGAGLATRWGPGTFLPHFDPAEAGVEARVLIVAEAPGPKTNPRTSATSSGFVSVDNDDPTAENAWRLRAEAGLHDGVLLWNMVPWYLGAASVKPTAYDLARGAAALRGLLDLLPDLQVLLLAGLAAQRGWNTHLSGYRKRDLTVIPTWHFSNQAMNQPGKRDELLASLRTAKARSG